MRISELAMMMRDRVAATGETPEQAANALAATLERVPADVRERDWIVAGVDQDAAEAFVSGVRAPAPEERAALLRSVYGISAAGRPRKTTARTERISLSVSPDERAKIAEYAEKLGKPICVVARETLLRAAMRNANPDES